MGYKPIEKKTYSLSEIAGNETVTDSRGRVWRIRVYTLGELDKFHAALAPLMVRPCVKTWTKFLQTCLRDTTPGPHVRLRRAAGLPDYSARRLARAFTIKDAAAARDCIVRANLDMKYDEFAARCMEIVKKKAVRPGKAGTAEPTAAAAERIA